MRGGEHSSSPSPLCTSATGERGAMVRNYVKKGGHGGSRAGAGLPAGYWEGQGGRASAAAKKTPGAKAKAAAASKQKLIGMFERAKALPAAPVAAESPSNDS